MTAILQEDSHGPAHANETKNRYRLLVEALRQKARWVICADADERYEEKFLRRLPAEVDAGERSGHHIRCVRIVNLWNSTSLYRVDGLCGPRWTPRMFKIPSQFTQRPFAMHRPWFPPELDDAPRAHMNSYLYHLKMIDRHDRQARFEKFLSVDPNGEHQTVGYNHLIDETTLKLRPVLPGRTYKGVPDDISSLSGVGRGTADPAHSPRPPAQSEFDELFYLNQHLDVQQAVDRGQVMSGWHHFEFHGAREGRVWRYSPQMLGFDFEAILTERRRASR